MILSLNCNNLIHREKLEVHIKSIIELIILLDTSNSTSMDHILLGMEARLVVGWFCDQHEKFVYDFMRKITFSLFNPNTCKLQHVLIDFDFKVVVDTIQCGYTNISYLQPVLANILCILQSPNINLQLHRIDR